MKSKFDMSLFNTQIWYSLQDYPNQQCSQYFVIINNTHTSTHKSTHLFPENHPLWMQFCKWLWHQYVADDLILHKLLWTDKAYYTHKSVFNVHNSDTCISRTPVCYL